MPKSITDQPDNQARVTRISKIHEDTPADSMELREMDVIPKSDTLDVPDHTRE